MRERKGATLCAGVAHYKRDKIRRGQIRGEKIKEGKAILRDYETS